MPSLAPQGTDELISDWVESRAAPKPNPSKRDDDKVVSKSSTKTRDHLHPHCEFLVTEGQAHSKVTKETMVHNTSKYTCTLMVVIVLQKGSIHKIDGHISIQEHLEELACSTMEFALELSAPM